MVYVDPKNLRYAPYWQRWVLTRPEGEHAILNVIILNHIALLTKLFIICQYFEGFFRENSRAGDRFHLGGCGWHLTGQPIENGYSANRIEYGYAIMSHV